MAFHDNSLWILSHIHNSFVSSDDTGICELVLSPEAFKEDMTVIAKHHDLELFLPDILAGQEEVESFRPHASDLKGPSRARSNTALIMKQRMMKGEQDQAKLVPWKSPSKEINVQESEELFPRMELKQRPNPVSRLAQQLEGIGIEGGTNPWQEYGVFEGVPNKDSGSKTVEIFPIIDQNSSEDSITICCSKEARVRDVIGLACLKYCSNERPRRLEPPVSSYELFMCEEDGTLDSDFPALDSNLALVKRRAEAGKESIDRITLYLPDGTFTEVEVTRAGTTVGELLDMGLEKRSRILPRHRVGFTYHLETVEEPGVRLDIASDLELHRGSEFFIVRDNSRRVSTATHRDQSHAEKPVSFLDAPLFQSFNVQIISKVRTKIDIHLGISGDKIEIDPQQQPSTWSVYKQKAATYDMDNIVSCEVVDKAGEERQVFKMIYLTDSGWRWTEFEGEKETVEAVIGKVNHLIEMRQTEARKLRREYLDNKEKKKSRRLSVK